MSGKFSSDICEKLYELSLDGANDEYGSVTEGPGTWYGLLLNITTDEIGQTEYVTDGERWGSVILTEDSQGFVDYEMFEDADAARAAFDKITQNLEAIYERF